MCVFCAQQIAILLLALNLFGQRCQRLDLSLVRRFHQFCNLLPYLPLTHRQVPFPLPRHLLCRSHRHRYTFKVDVCVSLGPSQRLNQARKCRNLPCVAAFLGPLVADKPICLSKVAVQSASLVESASAVESASSSSSTRMQRAHTESATLSMGQVPSPGVQGRLAGSVPESLHSSMRQHCVSSQSIPADFEMLLAY